MRTSNVLARLARHSAAPLLIGFWARKNYSQTAATTGGPSPLRTMSSTQPYDDGKLTDRAKHILSDYSGAERAFIFAGIDGVDGVQKRIIELDEYKSSMTSYFFPISRYFDYPCIRTLYYSGHLSLKELTTLSEDSYLKLIWNIDAILQKTKPHMTVSEVLSLPLPAASVWRLWVETGYLSPERAKTLSREQSYILHDSTIIDAIVTGILDFEEVLKMRHRERKIFIFRELIKDGFITDEQAGSLDLTEEFFLNHKQMQTHIRQNQLKFPEFKDLLSTEGLKSIKEPLASAMVKPSI